MACAANAACKNGDCTPLCSSTKPTLCSGGCTDTTTDALHCGGCGIECDPTESCENSTCRERIRSIEAASGYACVLLEDGRVGCWGYSGSGQLGSPDIQFYSAGKTLVELGEPAVDLALGNSTACALLESGAVKCWGENGVGQLARTSTELSYSATPLSIAGLPENVVEVSAMLYGFCVLTADSDVLCWGRNGFGQIGGASEDPVITPALANAIDGEIVALFNGANHTCVRTSFPDAEIWCWGSNDSGQLGYVGQPLVIGDGGPPPATVDLKKSIAAGGLFTCAIVEDGQVACWGSNLGDTLGGAPASYEDIVYPELALPAVRVFTGLSSMTVCAELSDGSLVCWGSNIGDGTNFSSPVPYQISSRGARGVAMSNSAYLLTDEGDVLSWGDNNYDQLGRLGFPRYTPTTCCRDW